MDQADLVLIHWPSRTLPAVDTIRSLNDVKRRGFARHIGVSNFTTRLLDEAWAATEEPLAVLQCEHHPCLNQDKVNAASRTRHGVHGLLADWPGQARCLPIPWSSRLRRGLSR